MVQFTHMLEHIQTILETLVQSDLVLVSALTVWFIVFMSGENGAIFILALAFSGYIDPSLAVVFIFLGSLTADMFWYLITISTLRPWIEKRFRKSTEVQAKSHASLFSFARAHPYTVLILIKFLVGLRLLLTIYIASRTDIPFRRYFICNVIANTLFVGTLYSLSWLISIGVGGVLDIKNNLFHLLTVLAIITIGTQVLIRLLQKPIERLLSRRRIS